MPLSEFLRFARGKIESGQQKPCPTDLPPRADDNLVELVWENGQVMMRGQSSKHSKSPLLHSLPSNRVRDATASRVGKFGAVESILNDISPVVPSPDLDLSQDDDMAPWLTYNIADALPQDYGSGILPEISGVTNNFVPEEKKCSSDQMVGDLSNCANALKGSASNARFSWSSQTSDIVSNISGSYTDALFGNSGQARGMMDASTSMRMDSQNKSNNWSFLNIPNFSGSVAVGRANLPNSNLEKMVIKEKGSVSNGSNLVKSTLIEPQKETDFQVSSAMREMASSSSPAERAANLSYLPERIESLNPIKSDKPVATSNTANSVKGGPDGERTEPMVASSSVGSGNSGDIVSCEQTHNSKRKFRDVEESECRSDDIETESVGVKKPTPGRGGAGSKRSRAAEVHNLSERRRRDRINEKMRALQELIPNCNKADKASMLDEAIEYLKTLQLQVQIMSMGAGLCMPPMMFPPGMQHMHPAHLPHFPSMGVGMGLGMRMGFGMGMVDMNGRSPIFPVPPMQGASFPSQMSGPTNFPIIPGSNIPLYGHPGPGLANSVPRAPLIGQPPVASAMGVSGPRIESQSELPSTSPILNTEDPVANKNSQLVCNAEASTSINHKSDQVKSTNGVLAEPSAMQENKQATDVNGPPALASNTETDIRPK